MCYRSTVDLYSGEELESCRDVRGLPLAECRRAFTKPRRVRTTFFYLPQPSDYQLALAEAERETPSVHGAEAPDWPSVCTPPATWPGVPAEPSSSVDPSWEFFEGTPSYSRDDSGTCASVSLSYASEMEQGNMDPLVEDELRFFEEADPLLQS